MSPQEEQKSWKPGQKSAIYEPILDSKPKRPHTSLDRMHDAEPLSKERPNFHGEQPTPGNGSL